MFQCQDVTNDATVAAPGDMDANVEVQKEGNPREAVVDAGLAGHEANINAHEEDNPSTLDFSEMALVQECAIDERDLPS